MTVARIPDDSFVDLYLNLVYFLFIYLFIYFPDSCFDWELLVLSLRRLLPLPLVLVLLSSALSLLSLFKQIIKRNDQPNDPSTLHTMSSESMREKV